MGICINEVESMRKQGKSIKAIARHFHCSDKKIAAIVRPIDEKKKSEEEFRRFGKLFIARADCESLHFSEQFTKGMISLLTDILKSKETKTKDIAKRTSEIIDKSIATFQCAALAVSVAAIWAMPVRMKKIWVDNIATEYKELVNKK